MKKYIVVYELPSGLWGSVFSSDDKLKAQTHAAREELRLGWKHRVYKRAKQ